MRNARATPPHALNITHSPALIQALDHHVRSDIGLATQTTKPVSSEGGWDVPANYVKVAFNVSSLERPTETATMRQVSSPSVVALAE